MTAIFMLAIKDIIKKWNLALIMALLFSLTFASFLSIIAYKSNLTDTYSHLSQNWLVVQKSDGIGEIHGSRLNSEIGKMLIDKGYSHPIPEIHQVVGTSLATGMLMRGVSLEDYQEVSDFLLVSGSALDPKDESRLAMVGVTLASVEKVNAGDNIRIRGRDFKIKGIFKTGTYQDNEAWISLSDAQKLLNYGEDVSIYIIPDGGVLHEGAVISEGISVSRKGETGNMFGGEISSFYNYLGMVAIFAGIATIFTLSNLLWRLAWLHRHEFGIIRTLGFGRLALIFYLFIQAALILVIGLIAGTILAFTVIIAQAQQLTAFGLGVSPLLNFHTISIAIGISILILLFGIAFPAIRINQMSIPNLLGRE
jgi:ABC-type lipoprotein release transport system permease subunit